jgi:site-specific DNA-methyltransferase (adenine-specific)
MQSALHVADNLELLATLPEGCCDLVYLDPPFGTGSIRTTDSGRHQFDDRDGADGARLAAFLRPRLTQIHRVMAEHATLYLHLDWRGVHHARFLLDEIFGTPQFLNEIIWQYRTGGVAKRWFGRKHDNILVYAKRFGRHRFNLLREGVFRTDGMKIDETGRLYKKTRNGPLYFHADGPTLTDVWDIPFLSTVSLERVDWPTQKPVALLERIIRASSNSGDLVADFFCGSGTTAVAAKRLGRRWLACDVNPDAVALVRTRLDATKAADATLWDAEQPVATPRAAKPSGRSIRSTSPPPAGG